MNIRNLIVQVVKRLIIGSACFIIIFILIELMLYRWGLYSIFALIFLIGYPVSIDILLNRFFINKLHKYQFFRNLHFVFFFLFGASNIGLMTTNKKSPAIAFAYIYSLIIAAVFSIKKRKYLKSISKNEKKQI